MVYLTFFASNFLHRQSVCMFLRFSQTLSSFLKLYDCCLFQFTVSFCTCWVTAIVICAHSVTSFIFCTIWSAFCTELFADCTDFNFSSSCRGFMWYSWDRKKKLTLIETESWLFMTSSVMRSRLAQLFWLSFENIWMYSSTFWFICSVASSVFRWYAVNTLCIIFKSWQTLFHRLLTNWVPQSETIAIKSSWAQ